MLIEAGLSRVARAFREQSDYALRVRQENVLTIPAVAVNTLVFPVATVPMGWRWRLETFQCRSVLLTSIPLYALLINGRMVVDGGFADNSGFSNYGIGVRLGGRGYIAAEEGAEIAVEVFQGPPTAQTAEVYLQWAATTAPRVPRIPRV